MDIGKPSSSQESALIMAGMLEEQPPGRSIFLDVCVQFTIFSFHMSVDIKSELCIFSCRCFEEQIKPVSGPIFHTNICAKLLSINIMLEVTSGRFNNFGS